MAAAAGAKVGEFRHAQRPVHRLAVLLTTSVSRTSSHTHGTAENAEIGREKGASARRDGHHQIKYPME